MLMTRAGGGEGAYSKKTADALLFFFFFFFAAYFSGKMLSKMGRIALIAEEMGRHDDAMMVAARLAEASQVRRCCLPPTGTLNNCRQAFRVAGNFSSLVLSVRCSNLRQGPPLKTKQGQRVCLPRAAVHQCLYEPETK